MSTVKEIGSAIKELAKALNIWASSRRIRYSLEANKQALKYMRRLKRIAPIYFNDKKLLKIHKKFIDLTTSQ